MDEVKNVVSKCEGLESVCFLGNITSASDVYAKLAFVPEMKVTESSSTEVLDEF